MPRTNRPTLTMLCASAPALALTAALLAPTQARAQYTAAAAPIVIDGSFDDWGTLEPIARDPAGDATSGVFDVRHVYATTRGTELFIRFGLSTPLNLQAGLPNDGTLGIFIENPSGQTLEIDFRDKSFVAGGRPSSWAAIDYVCLPTYASDEFELRIDLGPLGIEAGDRIMFDFTGSDTLRREVPVTFETAPVPNLPDADPMRHEDAQVRIASINTERGGFAQRARSLRLASLLRAVEPDVICFQEEWDTEPQIIERLLNEQLPKTDKLWRVFKVNGTGVATTLPMTGVEGEHDRYAAATVDVPELGKVLVTSLHLKCCGFSGSDEDAKRVDQIEDILKTVEAASEEGVPSVLIGDWNLVGSRRPMDIAERAGQVLAPLVHLSGDSIVTWFNTSSRFTPGVLDYCTYDASALQMVRGFVLDTRRLDRSTLSTLELDTLASAATDHNLLVIDLAGVETEEEDEAEAQASE